MFLGDDLPFLWKDGKMIDLGTLGGPDGTARGVNARGEVVGESDTTQEVSCWTEAGVERCSYVTHAFVWIGSTSGGKMTDLGKGLKRSFATGINAHGEIIGVAERDKGDFRAVAWRPR
jgi:probable HAF family extracellular repeat protein